MGFARELKDQLEKTGDYRVVLTRDRDTFVRLRQRIAIAREADADLFISLHADKMQNSRVRGASIYTLSERASDVEAAQLAAKENKSDLIAGVDLDGQSDEVASILIDLAQRETMNRSADLAKNLVDELSKTTRMIRNSHRFAGFAVLKAPDVPSVLIELGYMSNPAEEQLLNQPRHQKRVAAGLVKGINRYFARLQAFRRP